ncbi:VanZ family protein [Thalassomonas viridans]|uniref:VanZ family protein n=1 Tax=Thalassomonas viridans TaxID=137584 RepID=A0AAE9Z1I4_9GAMM|nr:VanZ family protein [Thalassomonas viridans]WDE05106.1 VanZ family protein [Thalassomonas viridans]
MLRIVPALLCFVFICWNILEANSAGNNIFFELVRSLPYGDKLGHLVLYGTLSLLTIIAFNHRCVQVKGYPLPLGALVVLALALAEELSQLFLSNRTFDMADISADIAGIVIFTLLLNKCRAKQ